MRLGNADRIRSESRPPEELGIDGNHDGTGGHEHRACGRGEDETIPGEEAGRERNRRDVVAGRPPEVLRSMIVTSVASSSQSGIPGYPSVTATLKTNATEMASA